MKRIRSTYSRNMYSLVHLIRNCPCGYCYFQYCNLFHNYPHESVVGSTAAYALSMNGYFA